MSKLIKCWEELVGLESENYKLDIDVKKLLWIYYTQVGNRRV